MSFSAAFPLLVVLRCAPFVDALRLSVLASPRPILSVAPRAPALRLNAGGVDSYKTLPDQLAAIEALEPPLDTEEEEAEQQTQLWYKSGRKPAYKVSGIFSGEPTFTRLFTHATWLEYTGNMPLQRWWSTFATWRFSTVLRAVAPVSFVASIWAYLIAGLPGVLLPRTSPVPMSLLGTALGLLLVFRTNNSYLRLTEARELWSKLIILCRDIGQTCGTALMFDRHVPQRDAARESSARVCRYLAAFAWEMRARLTGGPMATETSFLSALLPADEASWIAAQRHRPLQLLYSLRRELHEQYRLGNLPMHLHRQLEEDVS